MQARYFRYTLNFKRPSGTSRGVLTQKETWFLILSENGRKGIGECGILRGLSVDDRPDYEEKLLWTCRNIHLGEQELYDALTEFPSIQIGLETAFKSLNSRDSFVLFPSAFTEGRDTIPINGLVWMGDEGYMRQQIDEKIATGFSCIKMKIGAIEFTKELEILRWIRHNYSPEDIEIRVDANGAFSADSALDKLMQLAEFELHSIEQPIAVNQHDRLAELCKNTPVPIALDEELIGVFSRADKERLLENIRPQYIILKPSFIGGFKGTDEWIELAGMYNIGRWITSALESNVGLNAIAQYTFNKGVSAPQGLGTGSLYTNNIQCPLEVKDGRLIYDVNQNWDISLF